MRIYSSLYLYLYHFSSIYDQLIQEFSQLQNTLLEHYHNNVSIALLLMTLLSKHKAVLYEIEDL